jgi:hypothetical protein
VITIKTNLGAVLVKLVKKINVVKDKEYLLRPVVTELIPLMTERIHQEGKDSTGQQIGTYSPGYMKVRTGNYGNSARITKGANKGKTKNAGTFSRGAKAGQTRPQYHRSADTKVVVSLTRQLENDWSVIATSKGYGIGFLNQHNADKAGWVEGTYNKKIFTPTTGELEYCSTRLNELIANALSS